MFATSQPINSHSLYSLVHTTATNYTHHDEWITIHRDARRKPKEEEERDEGEDAKKEGNIGAAAAVSSSSSSTSLLYRRFSFFFLLVVVVSLSLSLLLHSSCIRPAPNDPAREMGVAGLYQFPLYCSNVQSTCVKESSYKANTTYGSKRRKRGGFSFDRAVSLVRPAATVKS